jgi:hypothetical protein
MEIKDGIYTILDSVLSLIEKAGVETIRNSINNNCLVLLGGTVPGPTRYFSVTSLSTNSE